MFDDLTHLRYANFSKQIPFADTIPLVSDGEPSLKPILRNFRDTEENWPSSSIIAILQRPFGVTITHFSDCASH